MCVCKCVDHETRKDIREGRKQSPGKKNRAMEYMCKKGRKGVTGGNVPMGGGEEQMRTKCNYMHENAMMKLLTLKSKKKSQFIIKVSRTQSSKTEQLPSIRYPRCC